MRSNYWYAVALLCVSTVLFSAEPITPIPAAIAYDRAKAKLGQRLFFDPILSRDRSVACVTCHDFAHGGADPRAVSVGVGGAMGCVQAPTVLNAVFNLTQFWNGRAPTLKDQTLGPILNPVEMSMTPDEVSSRLERDPFYRRAFTNITGRSNISINDVAEAIAEYEKTLITPNSPFDRYLRGEAPLGEDAKRGYAYFKRAGCVSCHNGVLAGGNSYQKIGSVIPYPQHPNTPDRYSMSGDLRDKNVFKVP